MHVYRANRSMVERCFWNADGEMMFVPQQGALVLSTELGKLGVAPGEIAVVPRGMKFRVELAEDSARGYLCENYGQPFRLPELGPIGSQGLAQQRDFQVPVAAFEDVAFSRDRPEKIYVQHRMWDARRDLVDWIENGAYFYVCGDAKTMAKDVRATLVRAFADVKTISAAEAEVAVSALERERRYLQDTY